MIIIHVRFQPLSFSISNDLQQVKADYVRLYLLLSKRTDDIIFI